MTTINGAWKPEYQQRTYRYLLHALSYPGVVATLDEGSAPACEAVLATLCDHATSLCDHNSMLSPRSRSFMRAREADSTDADFVLCDAALEPRAIEPRLSRLEHPEEGATLVLAGREVGDGPLVLVLSGPGIKSEARLKLTGFHPAWFERRQSWNESFPQGVDVILCDRTRVAALPRTTNVRLED
jgi:alpha-D-ribose 1-methylphosphonate 5-triphosphate synthase subunit PhnH